MPSGATLGVFLEALQGSRIVVELKRDVIVRGTLDSVDAGLGLTLSDVTMEYLQGHKEQMALVHLRGPSVRLVHVPSKMEPDMVIATHRRRIAAARKLQERRAAADRVAPSDVNSANGGE
mmetsp:Transcript_1306/g.3907  ORF Transcript_1306/g.3907 Transcript_1306/m.3907 type:complete len:120 (-) Transcript_1306:2335-2694(-)